MSNLGQTILDSQKPKVKTNHNKKKSETSSSSKPELRFPRDLRIYDFKCEGQGTNEQFEAYNKRNRKITKLERKWKPYQKTLDQLQQQYDNAVYTVREQAKFIDHEIQQLKKDNADNCPHPVDRQTFDEKHNYYDWEQHWDITEWTKCELCGTTILFKENGEVRQ